MLNPCVQVQADIGDSKVNISYDICFYKMKQTDGQQHLHLEQRSRNIKPGEDNNQKQEEWKDVDFIQTLITHDDKHLGRLEVKTGETGAEHKEEKHMGVQENKKHRNPTSYRKYFIVKHV